jgi:hypothetical protein
VWEFLAYYVNLVQQRGKFTLREAYLLKKSIDRVITSVEDPEISEEKGKDLILQGVNLGQQRGAFSLGDAEVLSRLVEFVESISKPLESIKEGEAEADEINNDDED